MNLSTKEDIWLRRLTDPATLQEKIVTRTLYKALIRNCENVDAWNEEEKAASKNKDDSEISEDIWGDFTSEWTVHGTQHFTMRSWFRRCIWAVIWLAMVIYSIYTCCNILIQYFKYPTNTVIGIEEPDSFEFPAVTICSLASLTPPDVNWYANHSMWENFHQLEINPSDLTGTCNSADESYPDQSKYQLQMFVDSCLAANISSMNETEFSACFTVYSLGLEGNASESNKSTSSGWEAPISIANITSAQRKLWRINCDLKYQLYVYQNATSTETALPDGFTLGDTSKCPTGHENPNLTHYEDIVCSATAIFQDPYGFYNRDLYDCNPTINIIYNQTVYVCSSCCINGIECFSKSDYEKYSKMNYWTLYDALLRMVIKRSVFLDGRDIIDKFQPNFDDIVTASMQPEKVISTCSFDRGPCTVQSDFLVWPNVRYGTCYTFNSGYKSIVINETTKYETNRVRSTSAYGPKNGLRITLNIYPNKALALLTPELGARVIFHKSGTIPFPEDEGFTIFPGVSNSIGVSPGNIIRAVPPWGKCTNQNLSSSFTYTRKLCQKQCLQRAYMSSCGCHPGIGPAYADMATNNLSMCDLDRDSTRLCLETVNYNSSFGLLSCPCPPSCSEWNYNVEFSTAITNKNYFSILQNVKQINVGNDMCANSTDDSVRLQVYLTSLSYKTVTATRAYSFDSLLSNLGGNFGLFIGATFISVVELTEFLCDAVSYLIRRKAATDAKKEKKYNSILLLVDDLSQKNLEEHEQVSPTASISDQRRIKT